jgi:glycosyltransferase involved in cell wall biosynthesis/SAM-dependent methyltransferase
MRVAMFSPLPPTRSGIADYTAALIPPLSRLCDLTVYNEGEAPPPGTHFDATLYHLGNNAHHAAIYERALTHPGIVILHEANLHHLHAERTIKRGNWDAYVEEVAYDGGPSARAFAERVRRLEAGPDYEGVPMLRRLLESAAAVIVHSDYVAAQVRLAGFTGPIRKIWHGAWVESDPVTPTRRTRFRQQLGIANSTVLFGVFGFLKPYKRIAESLRAFRRLLRVEPKARMILAGEPHPELDLDNLLRGLGLEESVRVLGYISREEDFHGLLDATDVVLNLRYPTVGESSGTLLRALSLGKSVIVTDIGSFREYPDEILLKVPAPPDPAEEDTLFEYMNLLATRPVHRETLGRRAHAWVAQECSWEHAAQNYLRFLEDLSAGRTAEPAPAPPPETNPTLSIQVPSVSFTAWAGEEGGRQYVETHLTRLTKTLSLVPPGGPEQSILEMGAYLQMTPALHFDLGYGHVRGCYYGPAGRTDHREITSADGRTFTCEIDLFDAEKDPFPYAASSFDTILCCELLEHLTADPMHMMSEINRILKPGGTLVLTTPNVASHRALHAILHGYHPSFFPAYILPRKPGEEAEARHNREYAPREVQQLLSDSGFETITLETGEFLEKPHPEHHFIHHLLATYFLPTGLRGDGIYIVGRKTAPVRHRYPQWLYA